jgi:hypothetical protein
MPHGRILEEGRDPPFDMRSVGEGLVWMRINQAVSMNAAVKIMAVLNEDGAVVDRPTAPEVR